MRNNLFSIVMDTLSFVQSIRNVNTTLNSDFEDKK